MYLLVVLSQWHDAILVRCYDFISGKSRHAESLNPANDSALISEFEVLFSSSCLFSSRFLGETCPT